MRTSDTEAPENRPPKPLTKIHSIEKEGCIQVLMKKKSNAQNEKESSDKKTDVSGTVKRPQNPHEIQQRKAGLMDLSKEYLVHLLGVMEGEVQAREDIIHMLQSERTRPEVLEAHYGSAAPIKPLQALQRDSLMTSNDMRRDDVYGIPMIELDRLEEKQRETYRRMLEQLLLAGKCHRRTVTELESEKRKHVDFMNKSDDFTNLLEQERERLKRLLDQEKAYQARKDKDHSKRLEKIREELVKLKSFSLMLLDERQLHIEQIDHQKQKIEGLNKKLHEREQMIEINNSKAKEDSQRIQRLELDLEHKTSNFVEEHEEMTTKLAKQESESRQMRLKLDSLSRRIAELEETNRTLQKSEDDLQHLRDKISRGECGNSSLMAELENLRKRVLEMEGKDEEITKTESQCKELKRRLQDEENHSREIKLDMEKLQKRMVDLEKLEGAFNVSKSECAQLHANLEREKTSMKNLACELESFKSHIKELECSETRLEKAEMSLKDDLTKLKSFTVILIDERKNMAERIKQEEQKSEEINKLFKAEQCKVMEVTEKLIEESKKLLKLKSEMEMKVSTLTKEKEDLKSKLASEEEKRSAKIGQMQSDIDVKVETEWKYFRNRAYMDKVGYSNEDNKVKELTQEIERLRNRLKQLEVVEGDLLKTEDEYDILEKKFRTEQDKANALFQLLEEMRMQITKNKAIEKGELVSQEAELRLRCKIEEAKSRDLQADVQALKEKIHELMNTEDQLSQLQVDYMVLQQRFIEEEDKKKHVSQEVLKLTKELEATKRYSRALRPSMNGRRIVDVPLASTAVQTDGDIIEHMEDETPAVFIQKSVLEENHLMSNLRQKGLKKPTLLDRYPPASAELGMRKSWTPWMKKKEAVTITQEHLSDQTTQQVNGLTSPSSPELPISRKTGQPLHIKVTPNHKNSTARLEITSPCAEDFFSSATIIPTLGLQKPQITIIPTSMLPKSKANEGATGPEKPKSPVTITTISRAKSLEKGKEHPTSPLSIITVSATPVSQACGSPEPKEMTMGRAVFKLTPEKQTVPMPIRKYNSNIITTEDNKIHIHLGSPGFKKPQDDRSGTVMVWPTGVSSDMSTGTVLRSPRQTSANSTQGKVTSSITITPITSAPSRSTQSVHGTDVQSPRSTATRIPMSKGMKSGKVVFGTSSTSRSESQSMKIELRKTAVCSSIAGEKS
ncbi:filamin-A-interacting protein 1-like [Xyrauchen texanus]|uniref:filamin-A-interacting protein 1-like n=1 Tax=Xyrauchen texanus TaxID=154827 RepID=UPI0022427B45|nr:filamin-A-interacting protein 1-like [Xyrauchen texanus]XP_051955191.1 filamin-A-interacting protein 1-like [Xyrauchen texanus]XP_051955192.1 filamin-A-interacting protein 1-like [Xyrauchen texanus]XP_051955193.1 filamin-A-interacting protein 1-like [Xyrauchen texanus]